MLSLVQPGTELMEIQASIITQRRSYFGRSSAEFRVILLFLFFSIFVTEKSPVFLSVIRKVAAKLGNYLTDRQLSTAESEVAREKPTCNQIWQSNRSISGRNMPFNKIQDGRLVRVCTL